MKRLLWLAPALGLFSIILAVPSLGSAIPAQAAIIFNAHVHDDYFHPAGGFVVGPGHATAQSLCMAGTPNASCTATVNTGDSVNWVAPAPLAANPHTVTECADPAWSTCGAGTSLNNPIEDSGVRFQPGWPYVVQFNTPGTYYYRCEVHPSVMRGIVQVNAITSVGGVSDILTGGDSGDSSMLYLLSAGAGVIALVAAGFVVRRRFATSPTE